MFSYLLGLTLTEIVLISFDHGQPALLYIVPSCVVCVLSVAFFKGDLRHLFEYRDH